MTNAAILPLPAEAYVYVIGGRDSPQKIGKAIDVKKRVAMLQTGSHAELSIVCTVPVGRHEALKVERYTHYLLRADHVRGEWFNVSPQRAESAIAEAAEFIRAGGEVPSHFHNAPRNLGKGEPWQMRAKAAGLSQAMLSRLLGFAPITISRQLRGQWQSGVPKHIKAAIEAWELMTPEQREAWLAKMAKHK